MNAPDRLTAAYEAVATPATSLKPGKHDSASDENEARDRARAAFKTEHIQRLDAHDLLALQTLAGFGATSGVWQTPKAWARTRARSMMSIDIAERVGCNLAKQPPALAEVMQAAAPERLAKLKAQGVLSVTRLALLCFLTPVGGASSRRPLCASTICQNVHQYLPSLLARAIIRRIEMDAGAGVALPEDELPSLLQYLTTADLAEFESNGNLRHAVKRLGTLTQRKLWCDTPPQAQLEPHTDPEQAKAKAERRKPVPFLPLPDHWLGEIGPRVLWCVEELAPNLLDLLEKLPGELTRVNWQLGECNRGWQVTQLLQGVASRRPWLSRSGEPLVPPFLLKTTSHPSTIDPFDWPPRTWDHLQTLSTIVQASHLFMTLMMTAGRIGEIMTLKRDCIEVTRSGKEVLRGHTYKLRSELLGAQRDWPAPPLLVQCLGQQARLVQAWSMLPESLRKGPPEAPRFDSSRLWASLARVTGGGGGGTAEPKEDLALLSLANRLGVDPRPGGRRVHPHRFRKTVARLAAIAMWQGPMVLKRLLGHKCIEMTLHYILSDPKLREEAEAVLRELRVMHCADTIEEIHAAMTQGGSFAASSGLAGGVGAELGGEGGKRITAAVQAESQRLAAQGQVWQEGTAYDLALMLTVNGSGWRLVRENVICAKAPGEPGACKAERYGQPNVSSCKPDCGQRVHLAAGKRDIEVTVRQYIDLCERAHEESQCLLLIAAFENLDGVIHQYKDIEEQHAEAYARIQAWVQEAQAE